MTVERACEVALLVKELAEIEDRILTILDGTDEMVSNTYGATGSGCFCRFYDKECIKCTMSCLRTKQKEILAKLENY